MLPTWVADIPDGVVHSARLLPLGPCCWPSRTLQLRLAASWLAKNQKAVRILVHVDVGVAEDHVLQSERLDNLAFVV